MAISLRLDHLALPVDDAAASLRFYRDVLGLPLLAAHDGDDWGGHPWLMMIFGLGDDRQLALCALRGGPPAASPGLPRDVRHIALSVPTRHELAAWRQRLVDHGIEHWGEDHGEQRSLYFPDPSGTILEVTTPPSAGAIKVDSGATAVVERWIAAGS
jgi:catechol 2,3-dioxygenase-like lactoylglutathione lyase family enzyme